jgi:hypothetical protein
MLELEIQLMLERYQDRLREAEERRLYQLAMAANGRRGHLRIRVAARLGSWMVAAGRRLEVREEHVELSSASPYKRVPQSLVASWHKADDCGPDGKLEGSLRKVA